MLTNRKLTTLAAVIAASTLVAACGSDSDDSNTAMFSLAISDAPVDAADEVWACFHSVELVGNAQGPQTFTIGEDTNTIEANDACLDANGDVIPNTRGINLFEFTGSESEDLLAGVEVPAGNYGQLRLEMAEGSYVLVGDTRIPLSVPSNELKFDSFTLDAGSNVAYTIEFDLRQALVNPVGQEGYFLKPRGVRLVDNMEVGHIEGTLAEALLIDNQCTVAPTDTSESVAAVYLYSGADVALDTMADFGGSEAAEPYTATGVTFDGATAYNFEIGFVATGDYTVAWTCDTSDDPEVDDTINFVSAQNVTVNADGTVTTVTIE
ncbi:DUF4382 domain-containing protein [Pseudidiomarina gelatinasegens]|jgi:hypothetical protein|uniref:DUF4382 domain-containing protein n=1 Tax=Pseudidiomarina gelatinasegens TaxID=2487740 RepID=A0A443Z5N3_9GAMM|nr:DUF4382 domain-containing protein [Pseudidiomarina gelatinasegens]RWU12101.1 DUF4382 domain-containing protein [Pseudidiomarina gelatinasegens]